MDCGTTPRSEGGDVAREVARTPGSVADIAEELMVAYAHSVPLATVSAIVRDANKDLAGQVPDGAIPELLHRLAVERLSELVSG